jgi:hypothetical protein
VRPVNSSVRPPSECSDRLMNSELSKVNRSLLTRYWFNVPGLFGFGVTAYSLADAFFLLESEGILLGGDSEVVEGVDVSLLEPTHIIANSGPPCLRGVWYPCLNIGWVSPGAHHPLRGGRVKAEPPFVCKISVGRAQDVADGDGS